MAADHALLATFNKLGLNQYSKCSSRVRCQPRVNTYHHPERPLRDDQDDEDDDAAQAVSALSSGMRPNTIDSSIRSKR